MKREFIVILAYVFVSSVVLSLLGLLFINLGAPEGIVYPILWATCFMVGWTSRPVIAKFRAWRKTHGKER